MAKHIISGTSITPELPLSVEAELGTVPSDVTTIVARTDTIIEDLKIIIELLEKIASR